MAIYYIRTDGSDNQSGLSDASAWKTIAKVNAISFSAGDRILFKRGNTWTGTTAINISHSGTLANPIVYGSYNTGTLPLFNFLQSIPGWNTAGNWTNDSGNIWHITVSATSANKRLWLSGVEGKRCVDSTVTATYNWYWADSGTILYVYSVGNPASYYSNIQFIDVQSCIQAATTNADYITIQELDLQGTYYTVDLSGTKGWIVQNCSIGYNSNVAIESWADGTTRGSTNDLIIRNNIMDSGDRNVDAYMFNNTYEGISQRNGANNWQIYGNYIADWTHGALGLYEATEGYVYINVKFHDNIITAKDIDYGYAFLCNSKPNLGACYGNEVYNNYIYNMCTAPIQINGDGFKIYNNIIDTIRWNGYEPTGSTSASGIVMQSYSGKCCDNLIYNNVFINCYYVGIYIKYYKNPSPPPYAETKRNVIANNIFLNNGTYDLRYEYTGDNGISIGTNTIKNNIFYKSASSDRIFYEKMASSPAQPMTVAEFNAMNGITTGMTAGEVADTITNNISGDPLFVDPSNAAWALRNYYLQNNSPAIKTGTTPTSLYDHNSLLWKNPPSIGAYEYFDTSVYYISNSGSDSYNGTSSITPWQTIAKVNAMTFNPSTYILFKCGDTWREQLTIPSSGSTGHQITFGSYSTGNKPKLYRSIKAIGWTNTSSNIWQSATVMTDPFHSSSYGADYPGNIWFEEISGSISIGNHVINIGSLAAEYNWVWVSNILYVYCTQSPTTKYSAVECTQGDYPIYLNTKDYITIDNLDLRYSILAGIKESYNGAERHGLEVKNCFIGYIGVPAGDVGYGISSAYSDSWYHNNEICNCGRRCISLNTQINSQLMNNCIVENNIVYDSYHTGIDISGINSSVITNIIIRNNFVYQSLTWPYWTVAYTVVPIYSGLAAPAATSYIYIYNNICINFRREGIVSELSDHVYIWNNTLVSGDNSLYADQAGEIWITGTTNSYIYNNIIYNGTPNDGDAMSTQYNVIISNTSVATAYLDYNLYYNADTSAYFMMFGSAYSYKINQFAAYKSAKNQDLNSPTPANPSFNSSIDFHLKSNSPAIHTGTYVGLITDYDSSLWNNPPSIGAYEYSYIPPIPSSKLRLYRMNNKILLYNNHPISFK